MRLSGYVDRDHHEGVVVSERVEADVTLEQIVDERLGSIDALPLPATLRLFFDPPGHDGVGGWNLYDTLSLREPPDGPAAKYQGVIRYDSLSAMVEFALGYVDPAGDGALSRVVADARRQGDAARTVLERALTGEPPRRRRRPHWAQSERVTLPVLPAAEFDEVFSSVPRAGRAGPLLVPSAAIYSRGPVLAREVTVDVSGRPVPRVAYLLAVTGKLRGDSELEPEPLLAFDGARHRWLRSLSDLSPAELDVLDREGRLYRSAEHDLLPMPHLRARCLLELPPRDALERAVTAPATRPSRLRRRLLERPGYLLDSRCPIELPRDLPVIDDPADVTFVLSHTTKGIFVPGDRGVGGFPVQRLPDGRHVLVLADVREDLFPCG